MMTTTTATTGYAASTNGKLCECKHNTFDAAFEAHATQNNGNADFITKRPTTWCRTCGNPVENNRCACWCFLAETLQKHLGVSFDSSAQMAADIWDEQPQEAKELVWSADYANDHEMTVYPDERAFAPKSVREQDALDHPHDETCPNCGRRTWGETDAGTEDICQSCGYEITWDDV